MPAPRGKGIYARDLGNYPNADPAGYAYALGCQFVALINGRGVEAQCERAMSLGLQTYIYSTPEAWLPRNWADTFSDQIEKASRLGIAGIIADVETANEWIDQDDELDALGEALAYAAKGLKSVGFTSFPNWPFVSRIAAKCAPAGVWGSPQLYGIIDPAPPAALKRRADSWRVAFGAKQITPSLAAWHRTVDEQADYLAYFGDERGAIFWQSLDSHGSVYPSSASSPMFELLRSWNVQKPFGSQAEQFLEVAMDRFAKPWPRFGTGT